MSYPWHIVTGADFARSIRWARAQPRLRDYFTLPAPRLESSGGDLRVLGATTPMPAGGQGQLFCREAQS